MKILIDNGHGIQTKGKRSPNGKILEYAYTRDLARQIVKILKSRGYDSELLVPEDDDIPLSERVRRSNAHCQALGKSNVLLISLSTPPETAQNGWMRPAGSATPAKATSRKYILSFGLNRKPLYRMCRQGRPSLMFKFNPTSLSSPEVRLGFRNLWPIVCEVHEK